MTDKHAYRIELFNATLALLRQGWYPAPDGNFLPFQREFDCA